MADGKPTIFYRIFGYWIRRDACRLAAHAAQGQCGDGPVAERLWSLTVFFESYLMGGSSATMEDFGYKEPVTLREHREA